MNFNNILEVVADDEERGMVPPVISGTVSVLNTRNNGAVYQVKMMGEMMYRWLLAGEDAPCMIPPQGKALPPPQEKI